MTQTHLTQRELDDALLNAAKNGDLDALKKAHSQGANIRAENDDAVRWAARNGHLNIVRYLVEEHNANIHTNNDKAFRWAAKNGHLEVVRYLAEKGANIHAENDDAMYNAAEKGHLDIVRYLVEEHDVDIHAEDDYALHLAAKKGHLEVVRYLLNKGANYKVITGSDFCSGNENSWPEDKLKDLFVLNFIYSHPAAAAHFWYVLPAEKKTDSLRQQFQMNYFLAMQNLKKKPRRLAQPQQRRNGANPS